MNRKLSAFTVMELMIGLLLTSIVIGIMYFAYSMLNRKLSRYTRSSGNNIEYMQFDKVIERDFDKAVSVMDSSENCLIFEVKENEPIVYSFFSTHIVRSQKAVVDSFLVGVKNIVINHLDNRNNLVSNILLETVVNDELIPLPISKRYTAVELMNAEQIRHYE